MCRKFRIRKGFGGLDYRLAHPRCELCGKPAVETHHILPIFLGGTNDPINLMALCEACHVEADHRSIERAYREGRMKKIGYKPERSKA